MSDHDDEIDGFELEGSELDVVTPSGFQTGIEIDGTSFEDNELDVYVGDLAFLKLLKAELEPDVDQPGMGTQFMILNQYETPLTGSFESVFNYFDDDGTQAIEVTGSTEHIRAKNKDIVWYARVGSYANSINNSSKIVYEQRIFEEESQFFESKYGQSYDAVYPIELNERGFIGTDLTDASFHTGSIRVAAPLRSVSITKNSFAIPLTRTALRWTQVSASKQFFGNGFSLAIDYLGRAWSWGSNISGQLGNGTLLSQPSPSLITIPPEHPGTWLSISAGDQHCLGIDTNGKGWAWGNNNSGELGDGTTTQRLIPTPIDTNVSGVQTWKQLSAGASFSLGVSADLANDGKGWAWGNNISGQLGDGTTTQRTIPTAINTGSGRPQTWKLLSAGVRHSLGISTDPTNDGKGWAWGSNVSGRLGTTTEGNKFVPTAIDTGSGRPQTWKLLSAGNHSLGISADLANDGKGWAWGFNLNGQLGDGTTTQRTIPTAINTGSGRPQTWKLLSAGTFHSLGISADSDNDGKGWAWGSNGNGQLGDGNRVMVGPDNQPFPAIIDPQNASGVQIWTQLSAGNFHSQGISLDPNLRQSIFRKIWGWGFNGSGAVAFGTEQYQLTPKTFTIGITDEEKNFTLYRSYMFGEGLGGRNLNDVTNGRSYVGGVAGGARSESFIYKNVEFDGYQVEDKVSPYILMPDDKLVVLCAHQPTPYDITDYLTLSNAQNQPSIELNAANLFRTKLRPGFGKIIFYGSYLRDGNPVSPESSQPLTSNSVHEDVKGEVSPYGGSHCLDQFQLEPATSLRKNYVDRLYEGSIFDEIEELKKLQTDPTTLVDPEIKRRLVALSVDGDYLPDESGDSIGTNWSLQRFVRLFSPRETYYDSHVPFLLQTLNSIFDPENFIENPEDYPLQDSSLKLTDKLFFFPFEPSLAGLPRSLNVDEAVKGTDAGSRAFESFQLTTGSIDIELNTLSNKQLINLIHGFGDTLDVSIDSEGKNVLRGVRYGLSNPYPKSLSAVFRHDRYGQFRDLLETSLDSAFFGESDQDNDNQLGLIATPVSIRFVERNTQNVVSDPESTNSQNLSVFATSSFPYFDDIPKDRLTLQPDLEANILNI